MVYGRFQGDFGVVEVLNVASGRAARNCKEVAMNADLRKRFLGALAGSLYELQCLVDGSSIVLLRS